MKRSGILSCPWSASRVLSPAPSARCEPAWSVVSTPPRFTTPKGRAAWPALAFGPAGSPSIPAVVRPKIFEEISVRTTRVGSKRPRTALWIALAPALRLQRGIARSCVHPSPALRGSVIAEVPRATSKEVMHEAHFESVRSGAHCIRSAFDSLRRSHRIQRARFRALRPTLELSFPRVSAPTTSLRCGQRHAPGLPHPASLRLQVFSTS